MNASIASWAVSHRGLPTPWQITGGPRLAETMVDGRAWEFTLALGSRERHLTVVVSREALARWIRSSCCRYRRGRAIQTDGREAARVAQFDPASCVVLGRDGYLPAPVRLARVPRT